MANNLRIAPHFVKDGVAYTPFAWNASAAQILDAVKNVLHTFAGAPTTVGTGIFGTTWDTDTIPAGGGIKRGLLYYYRIRYTPTDGDTEVNRDVGFMLDVDGNAAFFQERKKDGALYNPYAYDPVQTMVPSTVSITPVTPDILPEVNPPQAKLTGLFGGTIFAQGRGFSGNQAGTLWHFYEPTKTSGQKKKGLSITLPNAAAPIYDRKIWVPPFTTIGKRGPRNGSEVTLVYATDESAFDTGALQVRPRWQRELLEFKLVFRDILKASYDTWIRDWYRTHKGRVIPFLWQNWWDSGVEVAAAAGTGDGTKTIFALPHPYLIGSAADFSLVTVYYDGVEQGSFPIAGESIDWIKGKVTFASAPGVGVVVTLDYSRYVLVRLADIRQSFAKSKNIAYDFEVALQEQVVTR